MTNLALPQRPRGRPTRLADAAYEAEVRAWCAAVREIRSRMDFQVGTRGWCYILEAYGLAKGDFDRAEAFITECRKRGWLPLDICADDASRVFDGVGHFESHTNVAAYARTLITELQWHYASYTPISFWDDQRYYLELLVEKVDLKSLFAPICREYQMLHGNAKGWADLNQRAAMMRRFQAAEQRGQTPVLLYCGDHDPSGLHISERLLENMYELSLVIDWSPQHLVIDRFGLNVDFIEAHSLTWIDGLMTGSGKDLADIKHKDHAKAYVQEYLKAFGARKVEANALVVAPEAGQQLLRDTIQKYIAPDAPRQYRERLDPLREALRVEILQQLRDQTA